ncbi:MAG: hypothetical protein ACLGJB_10995 [Blastocatellia bacterium]
MKKILFGLSLSLTLIFSACSFGDSTCTYPNAAPAGTPWSIVYSDQVTVRSGNAKANGDITIPKIGGETCNQLRLRLVIGRNFGLALSASPASVYLPSPPTSGTVTGRSFDATYGVPRVDYFDSNGYLIGSAYATSVSSDGTWLQAAMPDLSSAYSGTYQVKVTNKTYSGYYLNIVGSATMTGWGRDRPDSDGDGWYDDEDCDPYDPYLNYSCTQTCGGERTICQPY